MQKTIEVVDNFYRRPHAVRAAALAGDWTESGPDGDVVHNAVADGPTIDAEVTGDILRIVGATSESVTVNGHFGFTGAAVSPRLAPHTHDAEWAAVICLTPPEICTGGLSFYRTAPSDRPSEAAGYEETMHIPAAFNRLVVFRASELHQASLGYGETPAEGRLAHVLLFTRHDQEGTVHGS